ncbi:MAG: YkgJ family cysteine cluster protein [Methanophagales archaeon ANME-1-THS]|nr:MAG: YkgJ family cysteine cluster protein [Methanophagales archaeon ANME-1-THS]
MNAFADKHPLRSGIPCVKHNCVQCCLETSMPLTTRDITRIMKLGYERTDFTIPSNGGGWRLKNVSGRCVFLSERGCRIYQYRPEGCRLYPLIYDEGVHRAVIDHLCPYGCEFKAGKAEIKKLMNLLERLATGAR